MYQIDSEKGIRPNIIIMIESVKDLFSEGQKKKGLNIHKETNFEFRIK